MPVVTGIRLSALAELLSAAVTDELFIRDESEPAVTESKRIAVSNLLAAYDALMATLTNKTLDADNNTVTNIGASEVKADLITGQTELAATPDSTDEALLSDAGVLKRISLANLLALYNALTATLTNKTIDADNNTLSNIGAAEIIADLITGQVELGVAPDGSDEVLISDAGVLKRLSITNLSGAIGITLDTEANILNSTPVSGAQALATDTFRFYVYDGTSWHGKWLVATDSTADIGGTKPDDKGIGQDLISDKLLYNIVLAGAGSEYRQLQGNLHFSESQSTKGEFRGTYADGVIRTLLGLTQAEVDDLKEYSRDNIIGNYNISGLYDLPWQQIKNMGQATYAHVDGGVVE